METNPGRNSFGGCTVRSITVDSNPPGVGPASRIMSTRPFKLRKTCSAVVGETCVARLALGAAIGNSAAFSNANATGCAGTRIPTVGPPAVTTSGTCGCFGKTSVSDPGQKRLAKWSAISGQFETRDFAASTSATCTMIGFVAGRPLAAKIVSTAAHPKRSRRGRTPFRWERRPVRHVAARRPLRAITAASGRSAETRRTTVVRGLNIFKRSQKLTGKMQKAVTEGRISDQRIRRFYIPPARCLLPTAAVLPSPLPGATH